MKILLVDTIPFRALISIQFLPLRVSKKRKEEEEEEAILNNKKKYFFKSKNSNPSVLQFMMKK